MLRGADTSGGPAAPRHWTSPTSAIRRPLSNLPLGTFVKPGTKKPATVNDFSVVAGYIDNPGSTEMTVYNIKGKQLGVLVATQLGFNRLYSTFPGAASTGPKPRSRRTRPSGS